MEPETHGKTKKPTKDIREVIREVGKYPPDAFQFIQDGLSFTVQNFHGEMSEMEEAVHQYMYENNVDFDKLSFLYLNDKLPEEVVQLISDAGGLEEINRHVSGENLCWGLRDYALKRWGALATTVLRHWNIRRTRDFGEIVFALVNNDYLQKQPGDSVDDFDDVYKFSEAFDSAYHINLDISAN